MTAVTVIGPGFLAADLRREMKNTEKAQARARTGSKSRLGRKSFRATLERMRSNLGWTIVWIPFDVYKTWGSRGNFRVKGEIDGFPFRSSLFPTRKGVHFLLVNKRMQKGSGAREGSSAELTLEPDKTERPIVIPPELQRHLAEDRSFRRWFDGLSSSIRKWLTDLIHNSKNPATRVRRAEQVAEQVFSAMEAERELPPAIKLALSRDPRALEGWQLMTPLHRRHLLLAIFYYRSPEAQTRRIKKVAAEAIALTERKSAR
jgi:uncharacterized protein YdeI (YjbR/CyaY-like superfamily)